MADILCVIDIFDTERDKSLIFTEDIDPSPTRLSNWVSFAEPNSEYVISVRAYNNIGDGRPIYETTRTRDEDPHEPASPLVPPVGLHAIVLSSSTVVLTWVDSSLPRNQLITDSRYYIVRYTSRASLKVDRPKHNYRNSTDLNCMLDDLRPNTEYEFTVKVVKGSRQSPWSLVVYNNTQEAAPESPPRDLAVIGHKGDSSTVSLTWLPPRRANGRINGYVIFYSEDKRKEDSFWLVEVLMGDKTSAEISQLKADTRYYFKIQARNSKGYGPNSATVQYRTRTGGVMATSQSEAPREQQGSGIPPNAQYAIFATGGVIVLAAVIFGLVMCRRGARMAQPAETERSNKPYLKGENGTLREKLNPPPPDLWINHDQLELKSIDSGQDDTGRGSSLLRSTPLDLHGSNSTLDRSRYIAPYSGTVRAQQCIPLTSHQSHQSDYQPNKQLAWLVTDSLVRPVFCRIFARQTMTISRRGFIFSCYLKFEEQSFVVQIIRYFKFKRTIVEFALHRLAYF